VNFFVNHADCFEYNGSELLDERPIFAASKINSWGLFKGENCEADGRRVDDFGNEEIRVLFNEDFWRSERSRRVNVLWTFKRVNRTADGMAYMDDDLEKEVGFESGGAYFYKLKTTPTKVKRKTQK